MSTEGGNTCVVYPVIPSLVYTYKNIRLCVSKDVNSVYGNVVVVFSTGDELRPLLMRGEYSATELHPQFYCAVIKIQK